MSAWPGVERKAGHLTETNLAQQDGTCTRQRLAAILAADAAGYSRLMASDEQSTMVALDAAREVFREQIESHHGRVIDMAGDSVLAVFGTATGAVSAALGVQQRLEALAEGVSADRRMRFRIGVHMGDVFEKPDGTVYGDGVNIAARLEGLALPGGVTVSDAVRGAVRHRVAAEFEDLGEQQVKNISDPVRAYRVLAATNAGEPSVRQWPAWIAPLAFNRRRFTVAAVVIATTAVLGAAAWQMRGEARGGAAKPITMSLAIGPIASPANDVATAQAAEALVQAMSTAISALRGHIRVVSVARNGDAAAVREAARGAGSRYVVEGDLQTVSPQRLLNLRLIETSRGTQVWSGRFDLPEAAAATETPAAVRGLIDKLTFAVGDAEVRRVLPMPVGQLDAMERVVRSYGVLGQGQSLANANEARKLLEEALRTDPTLVPAMLMMTDTLSMLNDVDPAFDHDRYVREVDAYSNRAVTLDPDNPVAWHGRSDALMLLGRWSASLEASERQVRLDPYNPGAYNQRASLLISMGRPAEALPLTERALALNPSGAAALLTACQAHLLLGAAEKAIASCERASARYGIDLLPQSLLAAAYANTGNTKQAQAALQAMLRTVPGYTVAQLRAKDSGNPEYQRLAEMYWYEGLRKAGLPDH